MVLIACPECTKQVSSQAATCPHCGIAIAGTAAAAGGLAAAAPAAPAPSAPAGEEVLWQGRPSFRVLVARLLGTLGFALALPAFAYALYWLLLRLAERTSLLTAVQMNEWGRTIAWGVGILVGLGVLVQLLGLFWSVLRLKSVHFKLTSQRLLVERGLVSKALEEIDLRYVDDTQFAQGVLQRLLGVGRVVVISSDKSAPQVVLDGVRDPRAVRERIRAAAYQVSQRQYFMRST